MLSLDTDSGKTVGTLETLKHSGLSPDVTFSLGMLSKMKEWMKENKKMFPKKEFTPLNCTTVFRMELFNPEEFLTRIAFHSSQILLR